MNLRKFLAAVAAFATLFTAGHARATPVLLDFEGGLPGFVTTNLAMSGFRVSPLCHFDFVNFAFRPNSTGVAMGFDMSGCLDPGSTNAAYLGAGVAGAANTLVFIDRAGATFDLTSLNGTVDLRVLSSNGGSFQFPLLPLPNDSSAFVPQVFSGAQWTGVTWIAFQGGGGGAPTTPVDNILFNVNSVPEPGTTALLGTALVAMATVRRRRIAAGKPVQRN